MYSLHMAMTCAAHVD